MIVRRIYRTHLKVFQREWFSRLLHYPFHIYWVKRYAATPQFGYVEALEIVVIEARVSLWQHKRLMCVPVAVDVTEVRFAINAITALARKDQPAAIA